MEQVGEPRDKPRHVWVPYFLQRRQEYTMGKQYTKTASSISGAGKTGQLCAEE